MKKKILGIMLGIAGIITLAISVNWFFTGRHLVISLVNNPMNAMVINNAFEHFVITLVVGIVLLLIGIVFLFPPYRFKSK